jgi:hypothetical protein
VHFTVAQFKCDFALHREQAMAALALNTPFAGQTVNDKQEN